LQLPHRQTSDSSAEVDAAAVVGVAGAAELVWVEVFVAVVAVVVVEGAGVVPLDELSPDVVGGLLSDALADMVGRRRR
jgi:hypothetical protein